MLLSSPQLSPVGVLFTLPPPMTSTVTVVIVAVRPLALPTPSTIASVSASSPQPTALRIEPRNLLAKTHSRYGPKEETHTR